MDMVRGFAILGFVVVCAGGVFADEVAGGTGGPIVLSTQEQMDRMEVTLQENQERMDRMSAQIEALKTSGSLVGGGTSGGTREERIKAHQDRIRSIMEASWARREALKTSGSLVESSGGAVESKDRVSKVPSDYKAFAVLVVDENGAPMNGVQVHLQQLKFMQEHGVFSSHSGKFTDDKGSVSLSLKDGGVGVVFANTSGDERRVLGCAVVDKASEPVKLVLKSEGRKLAGTIVDGEGKPVPHGLIGFHAKTREGAGEMKSFQVGLIGAGMLTAEADENGRFEVDKLPALPIVYWTAKAGDTAGLFEKQTNGPAVSGADLGDGDVLDFKAVLDDAEAPRGE